MLPTPTVCGTDTVPTAVEISTMEIGPGVGDGDIEHGKSAQGGVTYTVVYGTPFPALCCDAFNSTKDACY